MAYSCSDFTDDILRALNIVEGDDNQDNPQAQADLALAAIARLRQYEKLHDGLSEMIESGRLTAADVPNDYQWIVETLASLAGEVA